MFSKCLHSTTYFENFENFIKNIKFEFFDFIVLQGLEMLAVLFYLELFFLLPFIFLCLDLFLFGYLAPLFLNPGLSNSFKAPFVGIHCEDFLPLMRMSDCYNFEHFVTFTSAHVFAVEVTLTALN